MARRARITRVGIALVCLTVLASCSSGGTGKANPAGSGTHASSKAPTATTPTEATTRSSTVWVCRPGQTPNPCAGDLTTTKRSPDGTEQVVPTKVAKAPPIDCFYVYPTVSEQTTRNANLHVDAAIRGVAQSQAAPFSSVCRVFAPVYPQMTLKSITGSMDDQKAAAKVAYDGLLHAWDDYLTHDNDGRGFVLIGHSQGSGILIRLIHDRIDTNPALRKRLVSAVLLGGNVIVPQGKDVGGSFTHVPACRKVSQIHCVIAFSTFTQTPPQNSFFGRPSGRFTDAFGVSARISNPEVLCTNPASLRGGSAPLQSLVPSTPGSGAVGGLAAAGFAGVSLTAPTPWVELDGFYTAACVATDGADVLDVTPVGNTPVPAAVPDAGWGLHIIEVNLTLGNLVAAVDRQAATYRQGS